MAALLSLGQQPPSNRFTRVGTTDPDRHPLTVGQCRECSLIQLIDPMPVAMAKSRSAARAYNEPEGHLDELVGRVLGTVKSRGRAFGVTHNDDSTLARLERAGGMSAVRLSIADDLGVTDECAGLETIQSLMDEKAAEDIMAKHGAADVVVARYIMEHAHDPERFLGGLTRMLSPEGVLVLEVPDCRKVVDACDYSFIWEEHITYLSSNTLTALLGRVGLEPVDVLLYPQPHEDALVVVVRAGSATTSAPRAESVVAEIEAGRRYGASFDGVRAKHRDFLESKKKEGKRVALFGAGHLAVMFVNALGLGGLIEAVIDDDPSKQGLAMPGSGTPIVPSSRLGDFDLVLLALSAESEKRVTARFGGRDAGPPRFASIFARSPLALTLT